MTTLADTLRARTATDGHAERCDALDPCADCRDAAAAVRVARVPEQRNGRERIEA